MAGGEADGVGGSTNGGGDRARVSILLVEDDPVVRARLSRGLREAGEFDVREAESLAHGRAEVAAAVPRVLLTDLDLPDGSGASLIAEVRRDHPATEIMVVSVLNDEASVVGAISAGANGYLLKDAMASDIVSTVRDLLRGHSPISAAIARYIVRRTQGPSPELPGAAALTRRETDILWAIAKGLSYAETAESLGLSTQTVRSHIKNIYRKLEVNTRGEAVFVAVQQGLIRF